MWYLISEIASYLVTGFLLGTVVGWFFRSALCRRNMEGLHVYWTGRLKALDRANATARHDLDRAGRHVEEIEGVLAERHAALERVAKSLGEAEARTAELERRGAERVRRHNESAARLTKMLNSAESELAELRRERDQLMRRLEKPEAASGETGAGPKPEPLALDDEAEGVPIVGKAPEHLNEQLAGQTEQTIEIGHDATEASSDQDDDCLEVQPIQTTVEELTGLIEDQLNGHTNGQPAGTSDRNGRERPGGSASTDDLTQIRGIGRILAGRLNNLGIYTFEQIAGWTPEDVGRLAARIKGLQRRIARDCWVDQAQKLARSKN